MTTQANLTELLQQGSSIDADNAQQRIDRFLRKLLKDKKDISLSMIFKALRVGDIKVSKNGKPPRKVKESYRLKSGDLVVYNDYFLGLVSHSSQKTKTPSKKTPQHFKNSYTLKDFQSRIISEDDNRLALNKPAGVLVHPGNGSEQQTLGEGEFLTLHDGVQLYYQDQIGQHDTFKPNAGYRLDKYTSGLVIIAKTYPALQHINKVIREHTIIKEYQTIVIGKTPKYLDMQSALKKIVDPQFKRAKMIVCDADDDYAQQAHTLAQRLSTRSDAKLGQLSLLSVQLQTGRMHQIRAHCAHEGFPVLGDIVYGPPSYNRKAKQKYKIHRQLLHCYTYSFENLDGSPLQFEAPLPQVMEKIMPH